MSAKCEAQVWDRSGWHRYQCTRNAKRVVGTANYCEQHAKQAERRVEWKRL